MNDNDLRYIKAINMFCKEIIDFSYNFEFGRFTQDLKTNKACILNLQQIGENAKKLSLEFKQKYDDLPWQSMSDFRNIVAHDYFGIDLDEVWDIIMDDSPELLEFTETLLKETGK
jgi:uncharacterized protein with HEPN domain